MRVALVHDDLVQWGGAERVLVGLSEIFPKAPIFTSLYDFKNISLVKHFSSKRMITSFLQKIPGWRNIYKALLPLYPLAFEQFNFDNFDLVISHTTRFAKSIITKPQTTHICYCHTPPRFLWHFSNESNYKLGEILLTKLRIYDQVSARRVDHFIAGSKNAKDRIKKIYKVNPKIIYPFVDLKRFKDAAPFEGGYFVIISRINKYKKVELAIKACLKLGLPLKIIGKGSELGSLRRLCQISQLDSRIELLGVLSDELVVQVLSGAKALIIPGNEDFGLTALEAQALGKPVIAFKGGGSLETVIPGQTGILFDSQSVESLVGALKDFSNKRDWSKEACQKNAFRFSQDNFTANFKQAIAQLVYT